MSLKKNGAVSIYLGDALMQECHARNSRTFWSRNTHRRLLDLDICHPKTRAQIHDRSQDS